MPNVLHYALPPMSLNIRPHVFYMSSMYVSIFITYPLEAPSIRFVNYNRKYSRSKLAIFIHNPLHKIHALDFISKFKLQTSMLRYLFNDFAYEHWCHR